MIDWNSDCIEDSRILVSDGVTSHGIHEDQLEDGFLLRRIAEEYAMAYDHGGNDETYAVAKITDVYDGEEITFAFDGKGNFEWNTDRQYISY